MVHMQIATGSVLKFDISIIGSNTGLRSTKDNVCPLCLLTVWSGQTVCPERHKKKIQSGSYASQAWTEGCSVLMLEVVGK